MRVCGNLCLVLSVRQAVCFLLEGITSILQDYLILTATNATDRKETIIVLNGTLSPVLGVPIIRFLAITKNDASSRL